LRTPALPDDAHYRLEQVYRRMGETEKAQQDTELYKLASEKKNQQVEQKRHELQQFHSSTHFANTGAAEPKESLLPQNKINRPTGTPVGRRLK
jgi:hypothetical protein